MPILWFRILAFFIGGSLLVGGSYFWYTSSHNTEDDIPPIENVNEEGTNLPKKEGIVKKEKETNLTPPESTASSTTPTPNEVVDSSASSPTTSSVSPSSSSQNTETEETKKKKKRGGTAEHDSADNDDTGPVISNISSGSPATTSATITWTTNEKSDSQVDYGTTTAYGLSSSLYKTLSYTHSITLTGLDVSQTYHYRVRSQDDSEERTYSRDQAFTTATSGSDVTAPTLAEVTPISTPTTDTTPSYTFSSTEAGTISYGGSCSSATTSASSGNNTITLSALSDGTYSNCTVTVTDASSNASSALGVTAFAVDTTAPVRSAGNPSGALASGTTSTNITLTTSENATCKYSTSSGVTYASMVSTFSTTGTTSHSQSITGLQDGTSYNYYVRCQDGISNTNTSDYTITFSMDNPLDVTAPTLAEVTPVTTPTNDTTPNYTFSSTESGTISYGGSCTSATTSASSGNNTITFNTLSAGAYSNCTVTVTDASSNASSALAVTAFTVDTTNPTVSVTAPIEGEVISGSAFSITATASDNIAVVGVQFKVDGSNQGAEDIASTYSTNWNTTLVSDGSHTVTAVARDTAGNTATATTITVTVDNTGPILSSISSGTPAGTTATITWTSSENGDSQVDYGLTSSYGTSTTLNTTQTTSHSEGLTGLSSGTLYHYRVRSADAEGNITYSTDQTFTTAVATDYAVIQSSFLDSTSGVGATFYEQTRDMEYDSSGNLYITGGTPGSDFPTLNAYDSTFNSGGASTGAFGAMDNFIMKVGPDGELIWSTYFGGANYDRAYALELGPDGSVYIAGRAGDGFPTTSGVLQTSFSGDTSDGSSAYGDQDGFIARFDSDGDLIWSTYVGETGPGFIRDIDVDSSGNVHVAYTNLSASLGSYITGDAIDSTVTGAGDAAYLVISSDGQTQLYGTYIGGTDGGSKDGITPSIRLSASDEAYFYTSTNADDFITTVGAYDRTRAGGYDYALMKFNADYSLDWSTLIGGTGDEELETHQLALDASGNAYTTGLTKSTNYPITSGVYQTTSGGGTSDIAISKISADGTTLLASTYLGGSGRDEGEGITYNTATNEVVLTGNTASSNFPTTASALDTSLSGTNDSIVVKFNSALTTLNYSTLYGNTSEDTNRCIAISSSGLLATGGQSGSTNYPLVNSISASLRGTFAATLLVLQPQ